jgi:RNA polymerase sigma-70 factor (ECF subfamily)
VRTDLPVRYPSLLLTPIAAAKDVYDPVAVRREPSPPLPRAALDHLDALYRLARHLTGDDEDAEDLVQDAYTRALRARDGFEPGTNLRAWLFRILRNLFIDRYRRARGNPVRDEVDEENHAEHAGAMREPIRGDRELELLRGVVAGDIDAALRTLSADARTVVLLDVEGLTEGEIAGVLGCTVGTVKSRLSRARATLRQRLRDYSR